MLNQTAVQAFTILRAAKVLILAKVSDVASYQQVVVTKGACALLPGCVENIQS